MRTGDAPEAGVVPEAEALLAACLSTTDDGSLGARLAALPARGWAALAARAAADDVGALLLHRLERRGLDGHVPAAHHLALAEARRAAGEANARLFAELGAVVDGLGDIPVVVLKGAYLAGALYEHPSLRSMEDIDLLVPRGRLGDAARVLEAMGYGHLTPEHMRGVFALNHHLPPFSRPGATVIELHWSIDALCARADGGAPVSPFDIDVDALWAGARPARVAGHEVLALSPEDLLLHLCVHAGFHHGLHVAMRRLCDVALVAASERMDWARLAETGRRWRAEPLAGVLLRLARDLLGAPVPAHALARLAWTDGDVAAYPMLRDYVLHLPHKFTPEWWRRRPAVDRWLMRGGDTRGRGAHLAEAAPAGG